jgi:hypothetical protein
MQVIEWLAVPLSVNQSTENAKQLVNAVQFPTQQIETFLMMKRFGQRLCRWIRQSPRHSAIFAWFLLLLVGEWWIYTIAEWKCDVSAPNLPQRLAIVADPQLSDAYSYRQSRGILLSLVEFYSDIFMRRSYHALQMNYQPQAVLFLGDLTDGGREFTDSLTSV